MRSNPAKCWLPLSPLGYTAYESAYTTLPIVPQNPVLRLCIIIETCCRTCQDPVDGSPAVLVKRYNITQQKEMEIQLSMQQEALQRYAGLSAVACKDVYATPLPPECVKLQVLSMICLLSYTWLACLRSFGDKLDRSTCSRARTTDM